ncbi:MAG: MraY family glycosyltransferase, partial [Clostridia bacterium]
YTENGRFYMIMMNGALLACFLSLVFTPAVIWLCHRRGWYDRLDSRKIHTGRIPRLGGIAIFASFALTVVAGSLFGLRNRPGQAWTGEFLPVTLALIAVFSAGLLDDFRPVRAGYKFIIQLFAASVVVAAGFHFRYMVLPFAPYRLDFGWFGYPLSVFWIVGITNAINMIDGMDGLSGGIAMIAAGVYGMLYSSLGGLVPGLLAFSLAGAVIGYLFFNLPPARIFLGDAGAYFIGFLLAVLPLLHQGRYTAKFGILGAITVLAVPVLDVFAAIWRRVRDKHSVMAPDRYHLHHKLMALGFSTRQILAIVYASGIFLGATAISALYLPLAWSFSLMVGAWILFSALFGLLHVFKARETVLIKAEHTGSGADCQG